MLKFTDIFAVSRKFNIFTLTSRLEYNDALMSYKVANGFLNCSQINNLFMTRNVPYSLRNVRQFNEFSNNRNYIHNSIKSSVS